MNYRVVCNKEGKHSIWPEGRILPLGWQNVGFSGSEQECLDWIATYWSDPKLKVSAETLE
ncbi:MbtH family NRPS accessory protein [Photorhabdus laumondii subsp. laumondii]|uniref:Photorhabdus luminescens subsp. laumondii TTO1 complete genome segment 5/17 n=2 Tax=Photorhabdus laumondii subsp. laumondii TaxID=141679 RepID=Q7N7D4_PHOLL|nr:MULTISPECIES: MbtH family NRPS accessory protein [Photorhabdus]AWK41103.1 antibiotic synthesis protein MbtH [Photorhabdus laumondii subsp. laumondii]AXG41842.1 MbtH family protein [Photorhabdus laumondii subsp. laumondii]AXG46430.1 MbtH family protein [Photorhabdus laumondii subsp. laumondii]KTL62385.1 antibiotic synthesis protein MbtH [Photorhabdus laumondii subsp. laumondii]MCC8383080.1 MbtH family protein [Photorhabdus laumondii]